MHQQERQHDMTISLIDNEHHMQNSRFIHPQSVYFWAIRLQSLLQNQLSFAEVDFSIFVLELPLQNEKQKSSSTIRFVSQIEKQKLEFTIQLLPHILSFLNASTLRHVGECEY